MRTLLISVRARSHACAASARDRRRHSTGMCSRTRPGMKWRMVSSIAGLPSTGRSACAFHDYGRKRSSAIGMRRVQLDHMVEGEQRERDPDRRCGGGADFKHGHSNDPEREHDLEVHIVVGGEPDLAVDRLERIHNGARAVGMARQEFGLLLDLVRELVDLGARRPVAVFRRHVILQPPVELVVLVDVVVHHHAAGGRVDGNALDARDDREGIGNLLQQVGIALGRGNLHAHAPRHLMGDVEFQLGHGAQWSATPVHSCARRSAGNDRCRNREPASTFQTGGLAFTRGGALLGMIDFLSASASTSATMSCTCSCASANISLVFWPILYAPRTVDFINGLKALPSLGRYLGTIMVTMPSTNPGSRAASKIRTPAPTTPIAAVVASSSSWSSWSVSSSGSWSCATCS